MPLSFPTPTLLGLLLLLPAAACATDDPARDTGGNPEGTASTDVLPSDSGVTWEMPDYAERALSNAYVSVYRYAVAPGDSVSLQEGVNWLVFAEDGARLAAAGGREVAISAGAGQLFERPEVLRNAAADTARLVVVERTGNPLPDRIRADNPGTFLPDEAVRISDLESDGVRVLSSEGNVLVSYVRLSPGEVIPMHSGFSRVIYALSDYTVQRFGVQGFGGDGSDATATRSRGDALWNTASNFAVENVGQSDLEALLVAYYD